MIYENIALVVPALLMFGLKIALVTMVARLVSFATENDPLAGWLAAWLIVHVGLVAALLALSVFQLISTLSAWLILALPAALLVRGSYAHINKPTKGGWLGIVLFGAVFLFMLFRASIFQEFTLDAQTYGLARLGLWMNYGSILVHMPTEQINIFANEWNGELLSLLYGLGGHNIQGFMFGNVEVLLILFLSSAWLGMRLGASNWAAYLAATLVATTPACLGLAGTLKGDLLAVAATVMASGWVLSIPTKPRAFTITMSVAAVALAVGSKVTAAPIGILLAIFAVCLGNAYVPYARATRGAAVGLVLSAFILSRYIANAIVYGNPLKRVDGEKTVFGLDTLWQNLDYIVTMTTRFSPAVHEQEPLGWLISAGLGLTGFLALAFALSMWAAGKRPTRSQIWIFIAGALSILLTGLLVPQQPWSFRYFLSGVALIIISLAALRISDWLNRAAVGAAATVAILINANYLLWPGEINGNGSFLFTVGRAVAATPLERSILQYPPLGDEYGYGAIDIDGDDTKSIAVHSFLNRPSAGLIGSSAQNRLVYFETEDALMNSLSSACFDLVALTKIEPMAIPDKRRQELESLGYELAVDGDLLAVAKNRQPCAGHEAA